MAFEISGSGRMIGVGNGDTNSHKPEEFLSSVPCSIKLGDWRWKLADVPENGGALPEYAKDFDDFQSVQM